MAIIHKELLLKTKCKGTILPKVHENILKMEGKINSYTTRSSGTARYSVATTKYGFVVDIETMECSCGLWQHGGLPCVHGVYVYKSQNRDSRNFVHNNFEKEIFLTAYKHSWTYIMAKNPIS
ncbi:hypothetical protein LIER_39225 [Lithospermum erythrorhizon]|uniref:SWIM-type domain-containing protein n=1 Tax=Lithospermum erythrorhizon TaxID=34254 RepID=A0AAV3QCU0_LITER